MSSPRPFRHVKILLLGDRKIGKTSIVRRFMEDRCIEESPTVNVYLFGQMAEVNGHIIQVEMVSSYF